MVKVTPLPQSLKFIEGVINLRGEVIPIIDLRKRFNLPEVDYSERSRIIIVEAVSYTHLDVYKRQIYHHHHQLALYAFHQYNPQIY